MIGSPLHKILRIFSGALVCLILLSCVCFGQGLKHPNVSGQFYSANPSELSITLDHFFLAADVAPSDKTIEVIIAPHAGYVYSGGVAAYSYKAVSQQNYKTVVVIGLSHFVDFEGFTIWPQGSFKTPLGEVGVDQEFCQKLMAATNKIKSLPQAFDKEHSLEVQLPFLQKTFKDFKIVPLLTGRLSLEGCRILASALNEAVGARDDVLVVISTDMSHYHDDATARHMDNATLEVIKNLDVESFWKRSLSGDSEMCGFVGVATGLLYAKLRGLNVAQVLRYANSGDVISDKSRVVGYGSMIFYKESEKDMKNDSVQVSSLTLPQKKRLLKIARKTMEAFVQKGEVLEFNESDPRLSSTEGAFVTIHQHGQLRGCIGNIIGEGPLYKTIRNMAISSATRDPRFSPVTKDELAEIEIEISVLSVPQKISDPNQVQPGIHGVVVSRDPRHQGVFLPQVATEQGWSREEFLSNLCAHKAGLPADCWKDPQTTLEIFTADVFSEIDLP